MQVRQVLVLQLHQFLEIRQILFKEAQTLVRLLERLFLGDQLFFRLLVARLPGSSLGLRDLQLILRRFGRRGLVFHLCGYLAASFLLRGILTRRRLRSHSRHLVAVRIPIGGLRDNDLLRFRRGHRLYRRFVRNSKNFARLQAVHIAAFERALVGTQQSNEHLIERHTFVLRLDGDSMQGIAAPDLS